MRGFAGWTLAAVGMLGLFAGGAQAGELSMPDTNKAVDEIFDTARKIQRLEANVKTVKQGGTFGDKPTESFGFLRLSVPNLMWLQDFGDNNGAPRTSDPGLPLSSITLVDGKFVWDIQAPVAPGRPHTADKMPLAASVAEGHADSIAGVLGLFMGLGEDVRGSADLRNTFTITAVQEPLPPNAGNPPVTNHFTLVPVDTDNRTILEIWHRPGDDLPWKVQTTEIKVVKFGRNKGKEQKEITARVLSNTRTNLKGLPPFPANTFSVPTTIRIQEMAD